MPLDFSRNLKAFLKRFPLKEMSGQQKFVTVAAGLATGELSVEVNTRHVRKEWRKTLLGISYNPSFYDRAQHSGWVNPTGAKGTFHLTRPGIENLEALIPDVRSGELVKSGTLIIVNRKATHAFDKFLRTTLAAAKNHVLIADSWVDGTIFDTVLDVIPKDCNFRLLYARALDNFEERARRFSRQFSKFAYRKYKHLHDRFIVVDDTAYVLGPSIKDAASNSPALVVSLGSREKASLQVFFGELWAKGK